LIDEVNHNNRMPPRVPNAVAMLNNYQTTMSSTPYKSSYRSNYALENDKHASPVRNDYYQTVSIQFN
jgi:hypothetical protein